jgi:predicted nucleic acid-binding protein
MADTLIAPTAAVHRKIVVTGNVSDFRDFVGEVIDPWNLG